MPLKPQLLDLIGLGDPGAPLCYSGTSPATRHPAIRRTPAEQIPAYLQKTTNPKLHIGGGWRLLDGSLNTDLELIPDVMQMDATQ